MAAVADQRSWAQLVAPSRWQVYVQTDEGHSVYYTCRYLVIYTLYNSPVYNIFKSPNTNTNSACLIPVKTLPLRRFFYLSQIAPFLVPIRKKALSF